MLLNTGWNSEITSSSDEGYLEVSRPTYTTQVTHNIRTAPTFSLCRPKFQVCSSV